VFHRSRRQRAGARLRQFEEQPGTTVTVLLQPNDLARVILTERHPTPHWEDFTMRHSLTILPAFAAGLMMGTLGLPINSAGAAGCSEQLFKDY
jgi:hypothetical protein